MAVFKKNLTSKIISDNLINFTTNSKKKLRILEIGCGDGNISREAIIIDKKCKHTFHLSDISNEAIEIVKKKIKRKKIIIKRGSIFEPWKDYTFDIIISDVSSISDEVAKYSSWYKGVKNDAGIDGLKNIRIILKDVKKQLNKNGIFIFPIISLCNVGNLKKLAKKKFRLINFTKKVFWPLPKFFTARKNKFETLKKKGLINYDDKYGLYIAYTHIAICKK
tara:strand:+ start:384 stop:1046 length:663 start_codon:yes stop_codon:yes gene_type:complete